MVIKQTDLTTRFSATNSIPKVLKSIDQTNNQDQESSSLCTKIKISRNESNNSNKKFLRKMTNRYDDIEKREKLEFETIRPILMRKITEVNKITENLKNSEDQFISKYLNGSNENPKTRDNIKIVIRSDFTNTDNSCKSKLEEKNKINQNYVSVKGIEVEGVHIAPADGSSSSSSSSSSSTGCFGWSPGSLGPCRAIFRPGWVLERP